jgi:transposase-like protein
LVNFLRNSVWKGDFNLIPFFQKGITMLQQLLPLFPSEVTLITTELGFQEKDGKVYYFNGQMPLFIHDVDDLQAFRVYTSQLVINGTVRQVDIVRAFGVSSISVKRSVKKYREEGIAGFYKKRNTRSAHVLTPEALTIVQELLNSGKVVSAIARQLDLKTDTINKAIRDGRLQRITSEPSEGSIKSERSIADSEAAMGQGCTRPRDRIAAARGQLDHAEIKFKSAADVSYAGVLFALPALLSNGLLKRSGQYFDLPKGYYSLANIFILLAFMALLRIKSIEGLRFTTPGEMGKVLGLDRAPEVRTLRSKLDIISGHGNAENWQMSLSQDWMADQPELTGYLYVDGHVRVYYGNKTKLPKRYVARQRLCLTGTTDYWVNDMLGQPFFVVRKTIDPGLIATLKHDIIPRLLTDIPHQPSAEELKTNRLKSRFAVIFDREGYSPKLFKQLWAQRICCYTYRKYQDADWSEDEFVEQEVTLQNGEVVKWKLAERGSYLGNTIWMREIRKLTESGHQTSIITTDYLSDIALIAVAMFCRWSQENFFKYMNQHFGLDRLIEYETEDVDETTKVINPDYRNVDNKIRSLNSKLSRKKAEFGELILSREIEQQEVEGYEQNKAQLQEEIFFYLRQLDQLKQQRKNIDKHITFGKLSKQQQFSKLAEEKKHIMDTIKMIAYRAETAMANILKTKMKRTDDARALLRQIYKTEADIDPDENSKRLTIILHGLASKVSNDMVTFLCDKLNETETQYPGTNLRMVFKLVSN